MALSFDAHKGVMWVDGDFVPWISAQTHILNQGLHYAASVFEGERAYEGRIFRSKDHTRRLLHSANRFSMSVPFSLEQIEDAKSEVITRLGLRNAYVRSIIFRGSRQMGVSIKGSDIQFAIAAWAWGDYYADPMHGVSLTIAKWRKAPSACVPLDAKASAHYAIGSLAKNDAENLGFDDALMLDLDGHIAEATGANIFFVQDGALHTPSLGQFLNGITRQTIIHIARAQGLRVIERKIEPEELTSFSECFLTGSAAEITPIRRIDETDYKVGAMTHRLVDAYRETVRNPDAVFPAATLSLPNRRSNP